MWLGHFIEHLMCIGGELEHHKALPSPARKTEQCAVLCLLEGGGIYRHLIGPGSWMEPGLKDPLWSRFQPQTGTNVVGQERGALVPVRVWNRDQKCQTNQDQWPPRPCRRPGLTNRD